MCLLLFGVQTSPVGSLGLSSMSWIILELYVQVAFVKLPTYVFVVLLLLIRFLIVEFLAFLSS